MDRQATLLLVSVAHRRFQLLGVIVKFEPCYVKDRLFNTYKCKNNLNKSLHLWDGTFKTDNDSLQTFDSICKVKTAWLLELSLFMEVAATRRFCHPDTKTWQHKIPTFIYVNKTINK